MHNLLGTPISSETCAEDHQKYRRQAEQQATQERDHASGQTTFL